MLILFLCLLFCGISNCEYSIRCGTSDGWSFVESREDVVGRYRLEWCTPLDQTTDQSVQWIVSLRYNNNQRLPPEDCHQYKSERVWEKHSHFKHDIKINLNCTNVCLSTNFDLIFNGTCYSFETYLITESILGIWQRIAEGDYVFYVKNNYNKDSFSNSQGFVEILLSGDHVEAQWFLHLVPATDYTVDLCPVNESQCRDARSNCSASRPRLTEVRCALWPPAGPYSLVLTHKAPWTSGIPLFANITNVELPASKSVEVTRAAPPAVAPPAYVAPWWALAGALALALGGGAALLACRSHLLRKLRERVLLDWRARTQAVATAVAKCEGGGGGGRVLLLYARDCAPMMAVAAQLRALLQLSAHRVYDLYSAETVREAARAPAEWVRRVVARGDVRVVLLQSPAAAALHASALRERPGGGTLALEQPLLGRRAVYRAPHSSDALLPLALRLLADTAHTTHSYKKFYIATIAGLEAELVREVTPLRRYSLPAAAPLLLRDLTDGALSAESPAPPLAEPLAALAAAVRALRDHVAANPDYLDDELIYFHYD